MVTYSVFGTCLLCSVRLKKLDKWHFIYIFLDEALPLIAINDFDKYYVSIS